MRNNPRPIYFLLFLSMITMFSCSGVASEKKNDKSIMKENEFPVKNTDSLLFDPYFNKVFLEGQAYYKPSFNEKYIRSRKIKSINLKMFNDKNGVWKDYEQSKSYNFDKDGKLLTYHDYYTADGVLDTNYTATFNYDEGIIQKQQVGFFLLSDVSEDFYFDYLYEENEMAITEYTEGVPGNYKIYVYAGDALEGKTLLYEKEYVLDTLRAVDVFCHEEMNSSFMKKTADEWVKKLHSPYFLMLYVVEMKNGVPVYRVRLDEKGNALNKDEDRWEYTQDGKLSSRSYKTISDQTLSDKFEYGKNGLITIAYWGSEYKMEVSYTFH